MILGVAGSNPVGRPILIIKSEGRYGISLFTVAIELGDIGFDIKAGTMSTVPYEFKVDRVTISKDAFTYSTFRLPGCLNGKRIRNQFCDREEAIGEKNRLEVEATNLHQEIQATNTRLTVEQVSAAEGSFCRLDSRSLNEVLGLYLRTYRLPVSPKTVETPVTAVIANG